MAIIICIFMVVCIQYAILFLLSYYTFVYKLHMNCSWPICILPYSKS